MKFGKTLAKEIQPEWRIFFIDYKGLKKLIKKIVFCSQQSGEAGSDQRAKSVEDFNVALNREKTTVRRFYVLMVSSLLKKIEHLKHAWDDFSRRIVSIPSLCRKQQFYAIRKMVEDVQSEISIFQKYLWYNREGFRKILKKHDKKTGTNLLPIWLDEVENGASHGVLKVESPPSPKNTRGSKSVEEDVADLELAGSELAGSGDGDEDDASEQDEGGSSDDMLLEDFSYRDVPTYDTVTINFSFLRGEYIASLASKVSALLKDVNRWDKEVVTSFDYVLTIGCFDMFHRGHANLLKAMRHFGATVVVGIHDDESYMKLKSKPTVDKLEDRMRMVKCHADVVYTIPSTNPTPFLRAVIPRHGTACFIRGEDMPNFPGRDYLETISMPIFMLPRSDGVSSSLLRTIYKPTPRTQSQKSNGHTKGSRRIAFDAVSSEDATGTGKKFSVYTLGVVSDTTDQGSEHSSTNSPANAKLPEPLVGAVTTKPMT